MEKKVKARKSHTCDRCDGPINAGDYYIYDEWRDPKYEQGTEFPEVNQIGIIYCKYRLCSSCDKRLSVFRDEM